jgi:hypothetical protein
MDKYFIKIAVYKETDLGFRGKKDMEEVWTDWVDKEFTKEEEAFAEAAKRAQP